MKITIVIKSLNEEENIARAIQSSLKALKNYNGEVILADSYSTDSTIDIAKKFSIKIVQLASKKDRSCGVGPQLGFQYSKGDFVYILDGDMEINPSFLKYALKEFESDSRLAGVAGKVKEMRAVNTIFKKRRDNPESRYGYVPALEMGGLYRRKAILEVGYFSDFNLHAYEEAELGFRLHAKNWKLKRINKQAIKHYGYNTTTFGVFKKRWKTGYVKGPGDFLKSSLNKKYFWNVLISLRTYVFLFLWWIILIVSLFTPYWKYTILLTILFSFLLFVKKKLNINDFLFSIISWHYYLIGTIWGFFSMRQNPQLQIKSKVIK